MQRPLNADPPEVFEANLDSPVAAIQSCKELHPQAGDSGQMGETFGPARQPQEPLFGRRQLAGQELAFGLVQLQREGELVPALPRVVAQKSCAAGEIGLCRGISGRGLGALAGDKIELRQLILFLLSGDQRRATVELIHDLEDSLCVLLCNCMRRKQPANAQMRRGACSLRDLRIRRFLDAIMNETVAARRALDEFLPHCRPQSRVDLFLRSPEDDRQCPGGGDVANTSQLLQRILRLRRQAGELSDHQVHDVVGVTLGMNAVEIPAPARTLMIEAEHPLFGERSDELNGEERIATRFLVHQARKRRCALRLAAQSVRN